MPDLDLAVIGNGSIASLIDRDGAHQWCCWPRLDGDPIFHRLLGTDPQAGSFAITLDRQCASSQRYLPNTAIVETILQDEAGNALRILDFCPRFRHYGRIFRPPMMIRRIEPLSGMPRVKISLHPGFAYGAQHPAAGMGSNHLRYSGPEFTLRVTTDVPLAHIVHERCFTLARPGTLVLGADEPLEQAPDTLFTRFYAETEAYWQNWVTDLNIPFDWQEAVIRSAITLKLCSYDDTGGIVAALTTSVPEAPGSGRTWDYRFCWLRDSFFTIAALNRLSATRTMETYLGFVLDIVHGQEGAELPPLFPVAPGMDLEERIAPDLPGYNGDGPVRVGNGAASQRQNDAYGAIILSLAQLFVDKRLTVRGDAVLYERLRPLGEIAARVALEPDAGIWEFRGRARVHSFSAAMCWAALSRLALIATAMGREEEAAMWSVRAAKLRGEIMARIVTPEGWLSGVLDEEVCDASVLILPDIGFITADSAEFMATLDMVKARLMNGGFVMRYEEADDFGKPQTAFLLCSFWYVNALALAGRREEALTLFERVLAARNHVGLLSEDLAPVQDGEPARLWGNFPQTYSQVGLILCAMRLSRSWEDGLWRAS
ncbi:glycoside hydrolase family 15 protein [Acidocella sp. KAb 2-4]|uniref:glycoside hydrolase family 15 protein n=1 Tax=Acidocella sp. KAb 2-4 TaxID=2885158 RepID=UPI001D0997BB|nr:glycoside hydrolase family 15 protein [Acidocella sp. KAb 2-4]MCB5946017.1 glycoside hydrolase family 15 protein [Acidocella sp. KAb 2-4]